MTDWGEQMNQKMHEQTNGIPFLCFMLIGYYLLLYWVCCSSLNTPAFSKARVKLTSWGPRACSFFCYYHSVFRHGHPSLANISFPKIICWKLCSLVNASLLGRAVDCLFQKTFSGHFALTQLANAPNAWQWCCAAVVRLVWCSQFTAEKEFTPSGLNLLFAHERAWMMKLIVCPFQFCISLKLHQKEMTIT